MEEAWKGNEFSGLHLIIEAQVAENIDRMLEDNWLQFIDKGMKLGRFSASFLHRIVENKNGIFYALRDTNTRYQLDIIDLKNKIKGYRYTLEQLGKEMRSDNYDSDESIAF